jgi:hypothetical protein
MRLIGLVVALTLDRSRRHGGGDRRKQGTPRFMRHRPFRR